MQYVYNRQGQQFQLMKKIGSGGEAEVWTIKGSSNVAKIYKNKKRTLQQEAKLKAMVADRYINTNIAWPVDLLYEQNQFAGFLMPYVHGSVPIFHFYNPVQRKKEYPSINQKSLYNIALNLASVVDDLHTKGHVVIGDINESNILVNPQTLSVTIIDTDSFQISDQRGQIHHCQVCKPEYTPPELQGIDFKKVTVNRTITHDHFGLAVLIFQLLILPFG